MKKYAFFVFVAVLVMSQVMVAPALAAKGERGKNEESHGKSQKNDRGVTPTVTGESDDRDDVNDPDDSLVPLTEDDVLGPSGATGASGVVGASPTPTVPCDPNLEWKNHGAYVSCVAHLKLGGGAVSEAARSEVGKKHQPTPTPTPMETSTPTVTPTPPVTSSISSLIFTPLQNIRTFWENIRNIFTFFRR